LIQSIVSVVDREEIVQGIFVVSFRSPEISRVSAPGQFVNLRCGDGCLPLLRRPFSISRIENECVELMFNIIGQGTRMLASKRIGETIDVLGPLGIPFKTKGEYQTAILVGGGLGVAPFPFLTERLLREGKKVRTFLGARTGRLITERHLTNLSVATDDGSKGLRGTVVELLKTYLDGNPVSQAKIFGCGPTNMLKALSSLADSKKLQCELSLEGDMACGMGICQGCPVERNGGKKKYALVCVEGPTFDSKDIILR
jgi:dihydroorotate dehydrogenase electron transfer subunit